MLSELLYVLSIDRFPPTVFKFSLVLISRVYLIELLIPLFQSKENEAKGEKLWEVIRLVFSPVRSLPVWSTCLK